MGLASARLVQKRLLRDRVKRRLGQVPKLRRRTQEPDPRLCGEIQG